MSCPPAETIQDLLDGRLTADARAELLAHADGCPGCHDLVVELVRETGAPSPLADTALAPEDTLRERAAARLAPGEAVGPFIVIDEIGAGGMGVVVSAYDPRLERRVAIKVVRPGHGDAAAHRARLMREAQAMARLSHPHVITVYEVGARGDDVFIAMELVEGGTLSQWLRARRRPWREVLATFARVGSGLAAAHEAGLVHRDFKPDNVLVGKDGRVRVTDFGLVGMTPAATGSQPGDDELSLTRTGAALGTPAYMAPEQHLREPADARSDQFAFCVALHEALFGERPFAGVRQRELAANVVAGRLRAPKDDGGVPAHVRRVIARGLLPDRDARYPSMEPLLADLARDPGRLRRRAGLAVAAAAVLGAGAAALWHASAPRDEVCAGARRQLAGTWDDDTKRAVHAAFLASKLPYAEKAWQGVERRFDEQAAAWVAMRTDACEATRLRGEQSEHALDLRMTCLDRRRSELAALAGVFASADAPVVERSASAAAALTSVAGCADVERLSTPMPLPDDRALRLQVAVVRSQIAAADAYDLAGKWKMGMALADAALAVARATPFPPLLAEALTMNGWLRFRNGDAKASEQLLFDAVVAAEAGHHDEIMANARTALVAVYWMLQRYDEGLRSGELAAAILTRIHGDPIREARLLQLVGNILETQGAHELARAKFQRALELLSQERSPRHPRIASCMVSLGLIDSALGHPQAAAEQLRRALAIEEQGLGPDHPELAITLNNLGAVLTDAHDPRAALPIVTRALAIRERSLPAGHISIAASLVNVGMSHGYLGEREAAVADLRRALAIMAERYPEHVFAAHAHAALAAVLVEQGRYEEGVAEARRALATFEKIHGREHVLVAQSLLVLATALERRAGPGDGDESLADNRRAGAIFDKAPEANSANAALALRGEGRVLGARGQTDEALALLARARAIFEGRADPHDPGLAETWQDLGDVLAQASRHDEAIADYRLALAAHALTVEHTDENAAAALAGLGASWLAVGRPDEALPPLERAVAALAAGEPLRLAEARFSLARALWDAGADRRRAVALAREATATLGGARLATAQRWLARHR